MPTLNLLHIINWICSTNSFWTYLKPSLVQATTKTPLTHSLSWISAVTFSKCSLSRITENWWSCSASILPKAYLTTLGNSTPSDGLKKRPKSIFIHLISSIFSYPGSYCLVSLFSASNSQTLGCLLPALSILSKIMVPSPKTQVSKLLIGLKSLLSALKTTLIDLFPCHSQGYLLKTTLILATFCMLKAPFAPSLLSLISVRTYM